MGTRGAFGFIFEGRECITYNHFDSYPDGLGKDIVRDVKRLFMESNLPTLQELLRNVELVDERTEPSTEQIEKLKEHANLSVSSGKVEEWYVLLRQLQGELYDTIVVGYMIDSHTFMRDSLFCEWAYIANFDTAKLEVYRGFQSKPHDKGRYAKLGSERGPSASGNTYYPVALMAEFDFVNLPQDIGAELLKYEDEEEEVET